MTDTHPHDDHFSRFADIVAEILRGVYAKWGALEQVDNDDPDNSIGRRASIVYAFPLAEEKGYVALCLWIGQLATIVEERDGKAIHLAYAFGDYPVGTIKIVFDPNDGEETFWIDGKYVVYSAQELKDRLMVMWYANHWNFDHADLDANALLYRQFAPIEQRAQANLNGLRTLLEKLGGAWGGEPQTDNAPDPDDKPAGLLGGVIGKVGKKRYFVGHSLPTFKTNADGKATMSKAAVWLDLWDGKKGAVKPMVNGVRLEHDTSTKTPKRITLTVDAEAIRVESFGQASAPDAKALAPILSQLWKQDAFKLRG